MHEFPESGTFLGRVWNTAVNGPSVVTIRDGNVIDITSKNAPLVRDICEMDDPVDFVRNAPGTVLGSLKEFFERSTDGSSSHLLAPCDLQAVKACGVTFANSMVERVIEEQAAGDPSKALSIRERVVGLIGTSLDNVKAGSPQAEEIKKALIKEGIWSQYLEVGIGPDAEVFSKAQVLSSVGYGAQIGIHPISKWNNPEPEAVMVVSSAGRIVGATLGNDVNLRDVEGRSALLLSKAKDNNASCSIGPFIRLFDGEYDLDHVRKMEIKLSVSGLDGFELEGHSSMSQISRDPKELVCQTIGRHHQYPDGLVLFLGTLFAPTKDRDVPGEGFTHKIGDIVSIGNPDLGTLQNSVNLSTQCAEWTFGLRDLMTNLSARKLI